MTFKGLSVAKNFLKAEVRFSHDDILECFNVLLPRIFLRQNFNLSITQRVNLVAITYSLNLCTYISHLLKQMTNQ